MRVKSQNVQEKKTGWFSYRRCHGFERRIVCQTHEIQYTIVEYASYCTCTLPLDGNSSLHHIRLLTCSAAYRRETKTQFEWTPNFKKI